MDTQRWELAGNIFERLLGAPHDERKNLLDSICGEDAELRNIVVSMLDSESSAIAFEKALAAEQTEITAIDEGAPANRQVGPWRLTHELGTGGMGVVWMAERADGQFEQRAALKLIKRGMDSDAVLKRFLRERQILARLEHPNIAHLLDGGIASDGRPYFAMEYVEGLPLLRYCHEQAANLETRIRLFLDVCNAVQFAHTHHVVHRDLKPSNVLVTRNGAVKLLDFGIAKLLATEDSGVETITHLQRERPMTPAYAAPEQIRGGTISQATDIYALGCMLYEVLTGQRAYDFANASDAKDVLKIIEATDPVAPSRLKIPSAPIVLKRLRGDLDTIVLTALKHDPARRYSSVAAFAADLRNYLTGKPIAARRDSVFYRGYKFVRRHRAGMAASLAVFTIAVAAILVELRTRPFSLAAPPGSTIAIVDFNNLAQRNSEEWIRAALEEELATELAVGGALRVLPGEIVRSAHADVLLPQTGGYGKTSLDVLRKRLGADYVLSGSYLISAAPQPESGMVRLDLSLQDARSGQAIKFSEDGALADLPGIVKKAGSRLRGTLAVHAGEAVLERVAKAQPATLDLQRHMGLALEALHHSNPALARDELLDAVVLDPQYAPANALLAQAWKKLGYDANALAAAQRAAATANGLPLEQQLRIEKQIAAQTAQWQQVIDIDHQLLSQNPGDLEVQFDLVDDLIEARRLDEAEKVLSELRKLPSAINDPRLELRAAYIADAGGNDIETAVHAENALRQAQARDEPTLIARAKHQLAGTYWALGKTEQSERYANEAIEDFRHIDDAYGEADMHVVLGLLWRQRSQPQLVQGEYQKALAIYQRIGSQRGIALVYRNLHDVLLDQGDRDGAARALKNALAIFEETGDKKGQIGVLTGLAEMQMFEAIDEALQAMKQVIPLSEAIGDRSALVETLTRYADGLRQRGALTEAQAQCQRARMESEGGGNPFVTLQVDYVCGMIALDSGRVNEGVSQIERMTEGARALKRQVYIEFGEATLAEIEVKQKKWESAAARLKFTTAAYATEQDVSDEAKAQALLALCWHALGRSEQRDAAATRARTLRSRITLRDARFAIDVALDRLLAGMGTDPHAIERLLALADDAERRHFIYDALETRLAAWNLLQHARDPDAPRVRQQIETVARANGYGWILERLAD